MDRRIIRQVDRGIGGHKERWDEDRVFVVQSDRYIVWKGTDRRIC